MDLTEADDIKKRQQEYTEELNQKDLQDPDLRPGSQTDKASRGDRIPVELFQILKDDAVNCTLK